METHELEEKTENIVPKIQLEEEIVESPSKKAKLDLENEAENVEAQTEAETEKETKGQLISKCPCEKSVLSKIPTKKFPRFEP